mmetsp:Transcript_75985/g.222744  ORF Transcript_75985/g.222744 Transcript_75985/m.222744 type:complete len:201 (+) Transcript_75985:967-1569(+)
MGVASSRVLTVIVVQLLPMRSVTAMSLGLRSMASGSIQTVTMDSQPSRVSRNSKPTCTAWTSGTARGLALQTSGRQPRKPLLATLPWPVRSVSGTWRAQWSPASRSAPRATPASQPARCFGQPRSACTGRGSAVAPTLARQTLRPPMPSGTLRCSADRCPWGQRGPPCSRWPWHWRSSSQHCQLWSSRCVASARARDGPA